MTLVSYPWAARRWIRTNRSSKERWKVILRRASLVIVAAWLTAVVTGAQRTAVATGSAAEARSYYRRIATEIGFRDSATILFSRLDDVPLYAGYAGVSGDDLQRISPDTLAVRRSPMELSA